MHSTTAVPDEARSVSDSRHKPAPGSFLAMPVTVIAWLLSLTWHQIRPGAFHVLLAILYDRYRNRDPEQDRCEADNESGRHGPVPLDCPDFKRWIRKLCGYDRRSTAFERSWQEAARFIREVDGHLPSDAAWIRDRIYERRGVVDTPDYYNGEPTLAISKATVLALLNLPRRRRWEVMVGFALAVEVGHREYDRWAGSSSRPAFLASVLGLHPGGPDEPIAESTRTTIRRARQRLIDAGIFIETPRRNPMLPRRLRPTDEVPDLPPEPSREPEVSETFPPPNEDDVVSPKRSTPVSEAFPPVLRNVPPPSPSCSPPVSETFHKAEYALAEDGRQKTVEQKAGGGTPEPGLGDSFPCPSFASSCSEPGTDAESPRPSTDRHDRAIFDFPIGIDDAIGATRDDGRSQPEAVRDQADEYRRGGAVIEDDIEDDNTIAPPPPSIKPRRRTPTVKSPEQRAAELEDRRELIRAQGRQLLEELPTES